jgi:hypothetical protein
MAPFYPIKAKEIGVPITFTGQAMGAMAFVGMVSSFWTGKVMHKKSSSTRNKAMVILAAIILLIM